VNGQYWESSFTNAVGSSSRSHQQRQSEMEPASAARASNASRASDARMSLKSLSQVRLPAASPGTMGALGISGPLSMSRFRVVRQLGSGSYGVALLVTERTSGAQFVVKRMDLSAMDARARRAALGEAEVLSRLQHPNIVGYYGAFMEGEDEGAPHLHLLLEYCEGGDIQQAIKQAKSSGRPFSEDQIINWFCQLASALRYVHGRRVLHRDLKASNIFLASRDRIIKLADFGIARVLHTDKSLASTVIGTP
jgi:NIMA (never in mitosis gene a)-related kinase